MAIPNVNAITAQLRMMGDTQLKQYAAMHKNDPYILPMAIAESNARKEMRMQEQAKMAGQPQQKVADQAIASMGASTALPEEQGIGALPVQNMQRMADGGIAGYADGGGEFNFSGGGEPVIRMAGGGMRGPYSDDTTAYDPATGQPITGDYSTSGTDDRTMLERLGIFNPENRRAIERGEMAARARAAGAPAPTVTPYNDATATRAADYAAAKTGALGNTPPPSARPAGVASAAPSTPAPSYMSQFEDIAKKNRPDEAQGISALLAERKKAREEAGVTGEAGEAQKKAFEQEAEAAVGEKDQAKWMSIIKAGLSMAGGKSPHAMQNIAEGLGIGLDEYSKGLKEFKLAEKERSRGLAAIEEARRAEKRGDADAAVAAREKAAERLSNFNMHVMQSQASILGSQIGAEASVKGHEISAAATRAAAGASQRAQQEFYEKLGAAAPGSSLRKGYELTKQEGQEPRMYAEYVKMANDPMNGEAFMRKFPSFDVYKAGMGGGSSGQIYSGNALPAGALRGR